MISLKTNTTPFVVRLAAVLISLLAIGYVIIIAKELLVPLVFSLLFSILLLPISVFFERKMKFGRGAASGVAVVTFILCVYVVVYTIGSQLSNLASDWPLFKTQLQSSFSNLQDWIASTFHYNISKQTSYLKTATSKVLSGSTTVISSTLLSVTSMVLFTVLTLIYTFFLLFYRSVLLKFLNALVNDESNPIVHDVVSEIQIVIRKYILGLLLEMLIVATFCWLSFGILGIKYFILLGLITALFNIVPYIGIFTALLLSAVITFATTGVSTHLLLVVITIVVVHLIDSNVLLPLVVGSKVSINAMVTVIGVIVGEMMWGLSGMFLSVPVIAMLKIVCDRVEPLKPWSILLGHEKGPRKVIKFMTKKKIVAEPA